MGKPFVRFCEGLRYNWCMGEILWHRRETRRQTENTNVTPTAPEDLSRERCRSDAQLIRGETIQSRHFFANMRSCCLSSQLDRGLERARCSRTRSFLLSRGGEKQARRAMPVDKMGCSPTPLSTGGFEPCLMIPQWRWNKGTTRRRWAWRWTGRAFGC